MTDDKALAAARDRWRWGEFARVASYISDERHVYTGPRHRRRSAALEDLAKAQEMWEAAREEIEKAKDKLSRLRKRASEEEERLRAIIAALSPPGEALGPEARGEEEREALDDLYQAFGGDDEGRYLLIAADSVGDRFLNGYLISLHQCIAHLLARAAEREKGEG